ncbi:GIY-YIG nuclease family protein [Sphingobium yanoikuyae]|uniref:GIY-YIG nuclease family protein n=1 Tax=Sphingobium yanoikuyae TaxID=13690 RepID=A0A6M4G2G4_SPHYA|nr:GIY-YIG nuclease family protein [Sphingobium yanoikuyae]QJR01481.1 GIY-YIG nuclease family protein [Sphingobium yanoikuyae]
MSGGKVGGDNVTFIYVLHNESRGSCKIGKANNPETRARNLQTGNEDTLSLAFTLGVDPRIASKVERKAREIAVYDLKKPKTREWLGRTNPEEAKECILVAHDIVRGQNWEQVSRARIRMKVLYTRDDEADY